MSWIVSGRRNCSRHILSSTLSSAPSDCRSAKKYEIGTARILAIAARREALTRLAPCSYFWHLLEGEIERIGKHLLVHAQEQATRSDSAADLDINWVWHTGAAAVLRSRRGL